MNSSILLALVASSISTIVTNIVATPKTIRYCFCEPINCTYKENDLGEIGCIEDSNYTNLIPFEVNISYEDHTWSWWEFNNSTGEKLRNNVTRKDDNKEFHCIETDIAIDVETCKITVEYMPIGPPNVTITKRENERFEINCSHNGIGDTNLKNFDWVLKVNEIELNRAGKNLSNYMSFTVSLKNESHIGNCTCELIGYYGDGKTETKKSKPLTLIVEPECNCKPRNCSKNAGEKVTGERNAIPLSIYVVLGVATIVIIGLSLLLIILCLKQRRDTTNHQKIQNQDIQVTGSSIKENDKHFYCAELVKRSTIKDPNTIKNRNDVAVVE